MANVAGGTEDDARKAAAGDFDRSAKS